MRVVGIAVTSVVRQVVDGCTIVMNAGMMHIHGVLVLWKSLCVDLSSSPDFTTPHNSRLALLILQSTVKLLTDNYVR